MDNDWMTIRRLGTIELFAEQGRHQLRLKQLRWIFARMSDSRLESLSGELLTLLNNKFNQIAESRR